MKTTILKDFVDFYGLSRYVQAVILFTCSDISEMHLIVGLATSRTEVRVSSRPTVEFFVDGQLVTPRRWLDQVKQEDSHLFVSLLTAGP